ncbi:MAG: TRASH domain-containing protein [Persephonella sp.]|nr:TRASH domain-containing protein [Persephonella sp.]
MVNDRFMGIKQIPVEVKGKTYYGCCKMCISRLKNNERFRYATDPVSGKKVKTEAKALIIKQKDGTVLYFESKENCKEVFRKN